MYEKDANPKDFDHKLGYAIECTRKVLGEALMKKEMDSGKDRFEAHHGWIMGAIHHYDEMGVDVYQKDLEKNMHMSRSTMTGILQGFEKNGYIKRVSVNHDARLKKIVLTDKGEEFCKHSMDNIRTLEEEAMENIPEDEMNQFFHTLQKICENLGDKVAWGEENI